MGRVSLTGFGDVATSSHDVKETHHSHAFSQHEDKRLLIDGAWVGDEEVCERQMEKRDRCYNRFGRYERHRCVLLPLGMVVSVYLARL